VPPFRVLLVEDSPLDARLILELLRGQHRPVFAPRHADRLSTALEAVREQEFDAILLDLGLPDSQGLGTLARFLEAAPEVPIVVSTGLDDEETGLEAMRLGAQEYVLKNHWSSEGLSRVLRYAQERKNVDRRLRESEEQYRMLFDSHPVPMWVYDTETFAFLAANDAAEEHYGWSRAEFLAMTVADLVAPEQRPALLEALAAARGDHAARYLGTGRVWTHVKKDGTRIEVEGASNEIRFLGHPARLVLASDVSERRRFEAQLIAAQKMEAVGQLAGGIAHDFNNLLTLILGFGDLLGEELGADHTGLVSLEQIRQAGKRAAELTRQLLTFSRKQVVQPRVVDLNEALKVIERLIRPLIGEDVELIIRLAPGLGRVRADPGQLEQALLNLAVNARDAMPSGGRLVLETADRELDEAYARLHPGVEPGRYVMIAVADSGHGMDEATLARVFEPFFTTKQPGKGTGLGLATVHGIVGQSQGHVTVESEPGRGTTFRIFLPRVIRGVLEARAGRDEPAPGGTETVLVAEDLAPLRSLIGRILRSAGYTVLEAAGAEEAFAQGLGEAAPIHCLLTDVIMPQMSGRELADRLLRERPGLAVIFMSGYASEVIGHHGVLEAGTHFLQKPFSRQALLHKLREALDAGARPPE
jgi:PAS domain S-box-containing protein